MKETSTERKVGEASIPMIFPAALVPIKPTAMPMKPPIELVTAASMTNWERIVRRFAPSAFRIPISRVRSVTETSMMFITPTPATRREMPAMPPSIIDMVPTISFMESSSSLMAVTV